MLFNKTLAEYGYLLGLCEGQEINFTSVDTLLLWTLFVWPLAVHINGVLLYFFLTNLHLSDSDVKCNGPI